MRKTTQQLGYQPTENIGDRTKAKNQRLKWWEEAPTMHLPVMSIPDKSMSRTPVTTALLPELKQHKIRSFPLIILKRLRNAIRFLLTGTSDNWLL